MNKLLEENLAYLTQSANWLKLSYEACKELEASVEDENALTLFEALSSRFARTTDILISKVYRAIDYAELQTPGSLIDAANRACQRGLADDLETIRELKDLRNSISHDYSPKELVVLFDEILKATPKLLEYAGRAKDYAQSM